MLENQFRRYFRAAAKKKGVTGELLLQSLELRLDNVVHRLGFSSSRSQGRQLVRHGHIMVNGRKVNIPSYLVSKGDEISIAKKSQKNEMIQNNIQEVVGRGVPEWLELNGENFKGQVLKLPDREAVNIAVEESLIVELYSK